ncbi:MAG: hypothetical protein KDB00_25160 [Planctomycetales bacterium]|nr:hypothetical protein [Planctomycetales bacterium]
MSPQIDAAGLVRSGDESPHTDSPIRIAAELGFFRVPTLVLADPCRS